MDCKEALETLSEYQDEALDAVTRAEVSRHLRGCAACSSTAGSLAALREHLHLLPPVPAPEELLPRVLAAVQTESADPNEIPSSGRPGGPKPFLSRFRIPMEAAAVLLLVVSVYWYRHSLPTASPPVPQPVAQAPSRPPANVPPGKGSRTGAETIARLSVPRSTGAAPASARGTRTTDDSAGESGDARRPEPGNGKGEPRTPPTSGTSRVWTSTDLPAVPALRASSDAERIVPAAPVSRSTEEKVSGESGKAAPQVLLAPPSRLLRPLPYGRDITLDVSPADRDGAEHRVAASALRLGGRIERIEREESAGSDVGSGTVRVLLPAAASDRFVDELRRIGTVPPGGEPAEIDLPAGPRPGTVAYTIRIRVR